VFAELGVLGGALLVVMLLVAVVTFMRCTFSASAPACSHAGRILLGLLLASLFADQIYGNYLMSTAVYLLLGIAARLQADRGVDGDHRQRQ
jgi:hypothetical protein